MIKQSSSSTTTASAASSQIHHGRRSTQNKAGLSAHLSSIGIGDSFLQPTRILPSLYLAPPTEEANEILPKGQTVLSREIVGQIKGQPEDFVVREIALPGRTIGGLKDAEIEALRVASIDAKFETNGSNDLSLEVLDQQLPKTKKQKVEEPSKENSESKESDSVDAGKESTEKAHDAVAGHVADSSNEQPQTLDQEPSKNTVATIASHSNPLEIVRLILKDTLEKANNEMTVDQVIDSMRQLQEKLVHGIRQFRQTTTNDTNNSFDSASLVQSAGSVWIPPLVTPTVEDRGTFHRAVRAAFPMVRSESVAKRPAAGKEQDEEKTSFTSYQVKLSGDPLFWDLVPYLFEPEVDLLPLYQFYYDRHKGGTSFFNYKNIMLRLPPAMERKQRGHIHGVLTAATRFLLTSTTVNGYPLYPGRTDSQEQTSAICVYWSRNAKRKAAKKRPRPDGTSAPPEHHSLVVVRKRGVDHASAHNALTSVFRCRRSDIGFAGKKDFMAITEQFCTIRSKTPQQVARIAQKVQFVQLGPAVRVSWVLNTGDLAGNRFNVVVRNARRIAVTMEDEGNAIEEEVACDPEHISGCVERIRNYGFINYFGEQRVGLAGESSTIGVRPFEIGRALLKEDYSQAIDLIMAGREVCANNKQEYEGIRRARKSWLEKGRDAEQTLKLLPRCNYLHKERLLLNGLKRFNGDQHRAFSCIPREERTFWISTYQSYLWNIAATERINLYGSQRAVPGDLVLPRTSDTPFLLEEGMDETDIHSVVLPLVGTTSLFPTNKIGDRIQDILRADGIDIRRKGPDSRKGDYRYLICRAANLEHSVLPQDDDSCNIRVQFDLPKGSFATMMLRELMSTTISREDRNPEDAVDEEQVTEIDAEVS